MGGVHGYFLKLHNQDSFKCHFKVDDLESSCTKHGQQKCDYVEKADLSKGYQNPKRNLGVAMHFSGKIELKEIAIHSLYFNAFLEFWLLNCL